MPNSISGDNLEVGKGLGYFFFKNLLRVVDIMFDNNCREYS